MRWQFILQVVAGLMVALPAAAQDEAPQAKLRVGISPFAPFVMTDASKPPRGYSIDLWERTAAELGMAFEYVEAKGVAEKLDALQRGETDVAIGGISMTAEREARVDFTLPSFDSGLGILVRADELKTSIWDVVGALFSASKTGIAIGFLLLIVIAGHLVWFAERGEDAFHDNYIPGVFEGMYWAIVTASTVGYGDKAPVKWAGRAIAALVIIIALPMFAFFTAELASAFTVHELSTRIDGPEDLVNRRVGVLRGTTSAMRAADMRLPIQQWDRIEDLYASLNEGTIDAIIYDAPALQYYAQTTGRGKVAMVASVFAPANLGMAVQQGSLLRERINQALLKLSENGVTETIRVRWMGR